MTRVVILSSKGQFTIPKQMRQQLGLRAGSKVELWCQHGVLRLVPHRLTVVAETAGSLRPFASSRLLKRSKEASSR